RGTAVSDPSLKGGACPPLRAFASLRTPGSQMEHRADRQFGPDFDNDGGIDVRVRFKATAYTTEALLLGPVGPLGVEAAAALLGGVARIHFQEWDAFAFTLISQECFKLVECP